MAFLNMKTIGEKIKLSGVTSIIVIRYGDIYKLPNNNYKLKELNSLHGKTI